MIDEELCVCPEVVVSLGIPAVGFDEVLESPLQHLNVPAGPAEDTIEIGHTQFLLKQSCEQKKLSFIPSFRQVGH